MVRLPTEFYFFLIMKFLKQSSITRKDIFFLGMITIVGGQIYGWNVAYGDGMHESGIIFSILSLGYVALSLCLAEMASSLPFSGGIYGLVRAFVHPLLGSLVATFELMMNVFYIAPCVNLLASLPIDANIVHQKYQLVLCLLIYILITSICILGGKVFWKTNAFLGVTLLVFVLLYQFGSLANAELSTSHDQNFIGVSSVLQYIPEMAPIFIGIQFLPLTSKCAKQPKTDIPKVMMIVMGCSIMLGLGFMLLTASQKPDLETLSQAALPLQYGYSRILSISLSGGKMMNIPYLVGTIFGFTFFCGRQMAMMAKSGLLPSIIGRETPYLETPYVSLTFIAIFSFALNIIGFYDNSFSSRCFRVSSLASFLVFISAMIAYIAFHYKYSSLERSFYSPLQTVGAYIGILIFLFCFIGGGIYQSDSLIIVVCATVIAVIYSFFFAGKIVFSEEEKEEMFKAYLMNANRAAKKRMRKGRSNGSRSNGSRQSGNSRSDQKSECSDSENDLSDSQPGDNESVIDLEGGVPRQGILTRQILAVTAGSPTDCSESNQDHQDALNILDHSTATEIAIRTAVPSDPTCTTETGKSVESSKKITTSILKLLSSKFNQVGPDPSFSV